jgi:hypothetical protein
MAALRLEHGMMADIGQKALLYPSVLLTKEGLAQACRLRRKRVLF